LGTSDRIVSAVTWSTNDWWTSRGSGKSRGGAGVVEHSRRRSSGPFLREAAALESAADVLEAFARADVTSQFLCTRVMARCAARSNGASELGIADRVRMLGS